VGSAETVVRQVHEPGKWCSGNWEPTWPNPPRQTSWRSGARRRQFIRHVEGGTLNGGGAQREKEDQREREAVVTHEERDRRKELARCLPLWA